MSSAPAVFALADRFVTDVAASSPLTATRIGMAGHDHLWDDLSPEGHQQRLAMVESYRRALGALPADGDEWEALAREVLAAHLDEVIDWVEHGEHLRDLDSTASSFQHIRDVFDVMDLSGPEGWANAIRRLETMDQVLAGYRSSLDAGRSAGMAVARRQVLAVAHQARVHAGPQSFFAGLGDGFDLAGLDDASLRHRLEGASRHARTSLEEFADYLEQDYLPGAAAEDGVGRERYLRAAREHLGAEIDPDEAYAWGWEEIERLRRRLTVIAAEMEPDLTPDEVINLLRTDPARTVPAPDAFLEVMRERQQRAVEHLAGRHFDVPERIREVTVNLAPPGGPLGASYVPPSEDFQRPGGIWYSLGSAPRIPLYEEISIAYHEGFPGHHLQIGYQQALGDRLSRAHRMLVWYPGYGEGWALYAERLMEELGEFERPDYVIGMLVSHLMRACRVVIDIGCHLGLRVPAGAPLAAGETWDHDLAVAYLERLAFLDSDFAQSEATRYLGWPAQAIAYKLGERAILELREEAKAKTGAAFDLRSFHRRVLETGNVGLELLRRRIGTQPQDSFRVG